MPRRTLERWLPVIFFGACAALAMVAWLVQQVWSQEESTSSQPRDERSWTAEIARKKNGMAEYVLIDNSRVDILTPEMAYEVEWAPKWSEAIGQALFYAAATNRKPGVVLLIRSRRYDKKYFLRCLVVCQNANIHLETLEVEP